MFRRGPEPKDVILGGPDCTPGRGTKTTTSTGMLRSFGLASGLAASFMTLPPDYAVLGQSKPNRIDDVCDSIIIAVSP